MCLRQKQLLRHWNSWPPHRLCPSICHGVCKAVGLGRSHPLDCGCFLVSDKWPGCQMAFVLFQFCIIGRCIASPHGRPNGDGHGSQLTFRRIRSKGIGSDALVHWLTSLLVGCNFPPKSLAPCPSLFCGRSDRWLSGHFCRPV